jgi:hypothetical protein
MKVTNLITLATLAVLALNVSAKDYSSEELQQRMVERRAVDAVVWGASVVTLDMMRKPQFSGELNIIPGGPSISAVSFHGGVPAAVECERNFDVPHNLMASKATVLPKSVRTHEERRS